MDEAERERERKREKERETEPSQLERRKKEKTNLAVADEGHAPRRPPRRAAINDHGAVSVNDSRIARVDRGRDESMQGRSCLTVWFGFGERKRLSFFSCFLFVSFCLSLSATSAPQLQTPSSESEATTTLALGRFIRRGRERGRSFPRRRDRKRERNELMPFFEEERAKRVSLASFFEPIPPRLVALPPLFL